MWVVGALVVVYALLNRGVTGRVSVKTNCVFAGCLLLFWCRACSIDAIDAIDAIDGTLR